MLDLVEEQHRPTSLADLAKRAHLHENTIRGHLDGLAKVGLVARVRAAPAGRGRPAWLWSVRPQARTPAYAGLAAVLARRLASISEHPDQEAVAAGRSWGRELAADRPGDASPQPSDGARHAVLNLLADLGFAPESDGHEERIRLTCCPLLEVARELPDIVCNVHLGLVEGALPSDERDQATEAELIPFAEPGACLLYLKARDR